MSEFEPEEIHFARRARSCCLPTLAIAFILLGCAAGIGLASTTVSRTIRINPDQVQVDRVTGIATYNLSDGRRISGTASDPLPAIPVSFATTHGTRVDSARVVLSTWTDLGGVRAGAVGDWYPGLGSELRPEQAAGPNADNLSVLVSPLQRSSIDGRLRLYTRFEVTLVVSGGGVLGVDDGIAAKDLELAPASPNPFTRETMIRFFVPQARAASQEGVRLGVYDVSGRLIRELHRGPAEVGWHLISWDGRGRSGERVRAGTYFCRLVAGSKSLSVRLTLTR